MNCDKEQAAVDAAQARLTEAQAALDAANKAVDVLMVQHYGSVDEHGPGLATFDDLQAARSKSNDAFDAVTRARAALEEPLRLLRACQKKIRLLRSKGGGPPVVMEIEPEVPWAGALIGPAAALVGGLLAGVLLGVVLVGTSQPAAGSPTGRVAVHSVRAEQTAGLDSLHTTLDVNGTVAAAGELCAGFFSPFATSAVIQLNGRDLIFTLQGASPAMGKMARDGMFSAQNAGLRVAGTLGTGPWPIRIDFLEPGGKTCPYKGMWMPVTLPRGSAAVLAMAFDPAGSASGTPNQQINVPMALGGIFLLIGALAVYISAGRSERRYRQGCLPSWMWRVIGVEPERALVGAPIDGWRVDATPQDESPPDDHASVEYWDYYQRYNGFKVEGGKPVDVLPVPEGDDPRPPKEVPASETDPNRPEIG